MPEPQDDRFERIRRNGEFDAVVIGGGINGIGVFRDLALQGLRVLLVERNDFCSGCSSAPSRMIHGGLRYLENGEFHLVRESLNERDTLLADAPHMVRPLPTTIPITRTVSGIGNAAMSFFGLPGRPRPRGALPIKIGLWLYDRFSGRNRKLPAHSFHSAGETRRRWPELRQDLRYSATYHDAWISHPERLCIELIADATAHNPEAIALNYAELSIDGEDFTLTDQETGDKFSVDAKVLVNATGAWVDETEAELGTSSERMVEGTKGSHLILDNADLLSALDGHMIYFENGDGRVCIVFPYLGRVLAGATDIRVKEAGRTACTEEERDYILSSLKSLFPKLPIDQSQIVYTYSGIRPLPVSKADFTGRISRGHFVRRIDGRIPHFCMVGGKWTTFRAFAEQTTDMVLNEIGRARQKSTAGQAIGGANGYSGRLEDDLVAKHAVSPARAQHLVDLYGGNAGRVLAFCATVPDAQLPGLEMTEGEVAYAVRFEWALHIADVLQRRSPVSIRGDVSRAVIEAVAAVMARELGWDSARTDQEIEQFTNELAAYHDVTPARLERSTT